MHNKIFALIDNTYYPTVDESKLSEIGCPLNEDDILEQSGLFMDYVVKEQFNFEIIKGWLEDVYPNSDFEHLHNNGNHSYDIVKITVPFFDIYDYCLQLTKYYREECNAIFDKTGEKPLNFMQRYTLKNLLNDREGYYIIDDNTLYTLSDFMYNKLSEYEHRRAIRKEVKKNFTFYVTAMFDYHC